MTIPRQIGPETGPRAALPDFSRSSATVQRMVSGLRRRTEASAGPHAGPARALFPAAAMRDTVLRTVVSACCLGGALVTAAGVLLLALSLHPVHWLTAALRLRNGSRVVMPAFDRHI